VRDFNPSGRQRAEWGVTVTFKNLDGQLLTITRTGKRALADACDAVAAHDETFRVVCISTPESIYYDLAGRSKGKNDRVLPIEGIMLGNAGRAHMLHPDLRGRSAASQRRWHK
jgi:hypothetical protein